MRANGRFNFVQCTQRALTDLSQRADRRFTKHSQSAVLEHKDLDTSNALVGFHQTACNVALTCWTLRLRLYISSSVQLHLLPKRVSPRCEHRFKTLKTRHIDVIRRLRAVPTAMRELRQHCRDAGCWTLDAPNSSE